MAFALKLFLAVLSCVVFVQADVSHLGYSRYSSPRVQTLRLQRLESNPTPYPAAGYRPNREFSLPSDQPLFPLSNQQGNRPQISSGFDILSEPQRPQRPQVVYGSPNQEQPRFPQQSRPQNSNGVHNLAEPQQPEFVEQPQFSRGNQRPQNNNNNFNNGFNGGFNNLAQPQQPQQHPDLIYGAPNAQDVDVQTGFDNLAEPQQPQQPQRPQYNYNAPSARLREILVAHLKQAEQQLQQQSQSQGYRQSQLQSQSQQQQQQQFAPQTLYSVSPQQQQQSQAESQTSLAAQKPARLTDNREDREDESDVNASETVVDIETTAKANGKKNAKQTASTPVATAATGLFNYYPASAFSYVQPFSAAYVQPAAYTVGSPFLPQQYALATAAPAQLQAW